LKGVLIDMEFDYNKQIINSGLVVLLLFFGILLLIYFIKPFILAFGITIILVYVLHPAHEFLQSYVKKHNHATLLIFLLILVPFFIFSFVLISVTAQQMNEFVNAPKVKEIIDTSIDKNVSDYLVIPSIESINFNGVSKVSEWLFKFLGTVGNLFFQFLMALLLTTYVLYKEKSVTGSFQTIKSQKARDFILHVNEGLKAVVYSMFLTAFAAGLISIVLYLLFGVPYPILLGMLTGVVAFIPIIGAWLVYGPITLYIIVVQGNTLLGLGFLGACIVFISTVPDYVVRPIALSKKARDTDSILLLLGFLMGTLAFGPAGIIFGPLMMIALEGFTMIFILQKSDKTHTHEKLKED
jgi:predicted PurR-regulated permease PerM